MTPQSKSLEQRITDLERNLRNWKLVAGGVALLALAAIGTGMAMQQPAIPDVIRAHRFEAIGPKGQVQAVMGTVNSNSNLGILQLFNDEAKESFTARTGESETFVYIVNDKQQV